MHTGLVLQKTPRTQICMNTFFISFKHADKLVYKSEICFLLQTQTDSNKIVDLLPMTFFNGAIESLNAELEPLHQLELLPFDKAWEFPEEHLQIGMICVSESIHGLNEVRIKP